MLNNFKLLYHLDDIKEAVFSHFDSTSIENCWVNGSKKTVHISARTGNKEFNSWGTSSNEMIAIGIALMELIERAHIHLAPKTWVNLKNGMNKSNDDLSSEFVCLNAFLKTSSGLASHLDLNNAIRNSIAEIVERHVITKASLCNLGFEKIDDQTFYSQGPLGYYIVVRRHSYQESGHLYGTAASSNLRDAISSADKELSPQVTWSNHSLNIEMLAKSISNTNASAIQYYNLTNNLDLKTSSQSKIDSHLDESIFWYSEIEPLPAFKKFKSLKITRAFSPKLQPFYFGPLISGPINYDALEGFEVSPVREFNIVA